MALKVYTCYCSDIFLKWFNQWESSISFIASIMHIPSLLSKFLSLLFTIETSRNLLIDLSMKMICYVLVLANLIQINWYVLLYLQSLSYFYSWFLNRYRSNREFFSYHQVSIDLDYFYCFDCLEYRCWFLKEERLGILVNGVIIVLIHHFWKFIIKRCEGECDEYLGLHQCWNFLDLLPLR